MTLFLAVSAAAIFAAHASWPWALGARRAAEAPPAPRWLDRSPRWALAALAAAVIAALAALLGDVDRRLALGSLWHLKALRFAAVATAGLALADFALLLAPRESRERRATALIGLLGAAAMFGICWVFEVARAWGASTPRTIASAAALAAAAALLTRPGFSGGSIARFAALGGALSLASYAALSASGGGDGSGGTGMTTAEDAVALRVVPLAAAAALCAAEAWIPRRLRGFCRGLAIALALLALYSAWAAASVSLPFSTQPQPAIPQF